jgi:Fe-S cluster assembly iron-binding protein IscA
MTDRKELEMLTLTEKAADVIHDLTSRPSMPATTGLRISPNNDDGGAPALAVYLAEGPSPQDQVVEVQEAKVFLEPQVAGQLDDKVLDAQVDDRGGIAFSVMPQAEPPA